YIRNKIKLRMSVSTKAIQTISNIYIGLFSLMCLFPFILLVSSSCTSEKAIMEYGFRLWPKEFSTFAYKIIFENPKLVLGSYVVTILITVVGTSIGLFLVAMTGYALQRKDFPYGDKISFYIYFTTLFSGGLVPFYL